MDYISYFLFDLRSHRKWGSFLLFLVLSLLATGANGSVRPRRGMVRLTMEEEKAARADIFLIKNGDKFEVKWGKEIKVMTVVMDQSVHLVRGYNFSDEEVREIMCNLVNKTEALAGSGCEMQFSSCGRGILKVCSDWKLKNKCLNVLTGNGGDKAKVLNPKFMASIAEAKKTALAPIMLVLKDENDKCYVLMKNGFYNAKCSEKDAKIMKHAQKFDIKGSFCNQFQKVEKESEDEKVSYMKNAGDLWKGLDLLQILGSVDKAGMPCHPLTINVLDNKHMGYPAINKIFMGIYDAYQKLSEPGLRVIDHSLLIKLCPVDDDIPQPSTETIIVCKSGTQRFFLQIAGIVDYLITENRFKIFEGWLNKGGKSEDGKAEKSVCEHKRYCARALAFLDSTIRLQWGEKPLGGCMSHVGGFSRLTKEPTDFMTEYTKNCNENYFKEDLPRMLGWRNSDLPKDSKRPKIKHEKIVRSMWIRKYKVKESPEVASFSIVETIPGLGQRRRREAQLASVTLDGIEMEEFKPQGDKTDEADEKSISKGLSY